LCSIHRIEVVLASLIRIVHGYTGRGAVYQCPSLLVLMDGSTSSPVATEYRCLTNRNSDPWLRSRPDQYL